MFRSLPPNDKTLGRLYPLGSLSVFQYLVDQWQKLNSTVLVRMCVCPCFDFCRFSNLLIFRCFRGRFVHAFVLNLIEIGRRKFYHYFNFNLVCSVSMFLPFCSTYTSSSVGFSTRFWLKCSVSFKLLPALFCTEISKYADLLDHLVRLALYCLLYLLLFIKNWSAWWLAQRNTFIPYRWNMNFSTPQTTASNSSSPIEIFSSFSSRICCLMLSVPLIPPLVFARV